PYRILDLARDALAGQIRAGQLALLEEAVGGLPHTSFPELDGLADRPGVVRGTPQGRLLPVPGTTRQCRAHPEHTPAQPAPQPDHQLAAHHRLSSPVIRPGRPFQPPRAWSIVPGTPLVNSVRIPDIREGVERLLDLRVVSDVVRRE